MSEKKVSYPPCYNVKNCPQENGLTKEGELPPDADACITCAYAPWSDYEVDEE